MAGVAVRLATEEELRAVVMARHGRAFSLTPSRSFRFLLSLFDDTVEDLIDLLSDMRIAGIGVSRWELMSAPRRVELDSGLAERLAPMRRG